MNWHRFFALVLTISIAAAFWTVVLGVAPASAARYEMPPSRFDHEPAMHYEVRYRLASVFKMYCGTSHHKVGGCTVVENGVCYVTIREELGARDRADVLRHEKGHCNGWSRNHRA